MSTTVIKVENLSKQYRIGERESYKTFREAIVNLAKAPFRKWNGSNPQSTIDQAELVAGRNPQSETIWALKEVSFEVKQGEVVGIIGRNGAGKSTLLRILSKITEPTSGRILLRGRVGSLLEVGTGFHPELTGHENIYLYGAILGMGRWEVTRKFDEIVAFAEIEKFIDTPVKRYSSGMYMRLAFSVAAHLEPEILMVDEVLAVGDAAFQEKCLGKMEDVSEKGRTVLFVSHNMPAITALCTRSLLLNQGSIVMDSDPSKVVSFYLNSGSKPMGRIDFDEDQSKKIQIRSIMILNHNGEICTRINREKNFCVVISYDVRYETAGAHVGCYIKDEYGKWILASTDCDIDRSQLIGKRKIGKYLAKLEIPGGFINSGQYYIIAGIAIHNVELFDWQEGPIFKLENTKYCNPISIKESIHAVLAVKLSWTLEFLE